MKYLFYSFILLGTKMSRTHGGQEWKFLAGLACGPAWKYDLLYNEITSNFIYYFYFYIWGCLGVTEDVMDVKIDL